MNDEWVTGFLVKPILITILALSPVVQVTKNHISVNGGVKKPKFEVTSFLLKHNIFEIILPYSE